MSDKATQATDTLAAASTAAADTSLDRLRAMYRGFAEGEARGHSPLYEELASKVADDPPTLEFLAQLPRAKQQPNLLFAAVKYLFGAANGWEQFRALLREHRDEIAAVMLSHRTQTNEPARCATLMPLLATLPQPLALIEVGAAAGLCLLPDRYAYQYGAVTVPPKSPRRAEPPLFSCRHNDATPIPVDGIQVAWRGGLDLEPIDLNDPDKVAWLEALVWPDEHDRLRLLRAAIEVARDDPPPIVRGDLRTDLAALVAQAPRDATVVVFHSAVLAYVTDPAERAAFARSVRSLGVVWISNEAPQLLPEIAQGLSETGPARRFILAMDGNPVAWTDPHGAQIDWIAPR